MRVKIVLVVILIVLSIFSLYLYAENNRLAQDNKRYLDTINSQELRIVNLQGKLSQETPHETPEREPPRRGCADFFYIPPPQKQE